MGVVPAQVQDQVPGINPVHIQNVHQAAEAMAAEVIMAAVEAHLKHMHVRHPHRALLRIHNGATIPRQRQRHNMRINVQALRQWQPVSGQIVFITS